jgi:hypothetical protein
VLPGQRSIFRWKPGVYFFEETESSAGTVRAGTFCSESGRTEPVVSGFNEEAFALSAAAGGVPGTIGSTVESC